MRTFLIATFLFAFPTALSHADKPAPVNFAKYKTALKIIACESGGRHIWSKVDFNPPTFGISQFRSDTFYMLARQCAMPDADWKNRDDQTAVTICAVELGKTKHWKASQSCWDRI